MRNMGTQDLPEDVSNVTIATMKIVLISHPFEDSRDMCVQYFKTKTTTERSHLMRLLWSTTTQDAKNATRNLKLQLK